MSIHNFCPNCGTDLSNTSPYAQACLECGHPLRKSNRGEVSEKSLAIAGLLCFFLGWLGIHRFYVGKVGTGILILLLSFSVFLSFISVIWWIIDFIVLLTGLFTDNVGRLVRK